MSEADSTETLREVLDLELIDVNLFRANFVFRDKYALFGGQVAAQALRAASMTVDGGRLPHSLHGYFLRAGNTSIPTVYQVFRDRDGRSFSARRVVALQHGEVIFNMSASFQHVEGGFEDQEVTMPTVPAPEDARSYPIPRLFSYEGREVPQPYGRSDWPTRFWARCEVSFDDPVLDACALTYLSDISTGLSRFNTNEYSLSSSLDHAVWFHRPARADAWVLNDLVPHTVSGGRGWYTGSMFDSSGRLVASLAQEALFRKRPIP